MSTFEDHRLGLARPSIAFFPWKLNHQSKTRFCPGEWATWQLLSKLLCLLFVHVMCNLYMALYRLVSFICTSRMHAVYTFVKILCRLTRAYRLTVTHWVLAMQMLVRLLIPVPGQARLCKEHAKNWEINFSFVIHVNLEHAWAEHYPVTLNKL